MRNRQLFLSLALGLIVLCQTVPGTGAAPANTCPLPSDDIEDESLEESINETLNLMETATSRLVEDMESLDMHLRSESVERDGDGSSLEDSLQALDNLANSEEGAKLYEQLKALNEQLEAAGVKAFGDLEEAAYRREGGEGDWVVPALKEDLEACKTELQMQAEEAGQAQEVVPEAPAPATAPTMALKKESAKADELPPSGGQGPPKLGLRQESAGEEEAPEEEEPSECASCDALEVDMQEAEEEGARLFRELQELNPLVKESIYKRNGDWRIATLKEDIYACSDMDEDAKGSGAGEKKNVEEGKEDRLKKMADLFGSANLNEQVASATAEAEAAKEEAAKKPPPRDDEDERAC